MHGDLDEVPVRITKEDLVEVIKKKHPDEEATLWEDHVSWRLFKFWFNKSGRIYLVYWSS